MILALIFGFMAGIFAASIFPVTLGIFIFIFFLSTLCFVYQYYIAPEHRHVVLLCTVVLIGVLVGMGRMCISNLYTRSNLQQFAGSTIRAQGIVVGEPDVREHNTQLMIGLRSVSVGTTTKKSIPVHETILISVPLYPEFSYGDQVNVTATLAAPQDIVSPEGRVFNYAGYLRARDIWYVGKNPYINFVSSGHGSILESWLFAVKHAFTHAVNRVIPEPESSLMGGLLIGAKQALGKDLLAEFSRAGVSHVVVLSGYNIAIVAESIMAVLGFLPALIAFSIGCISIILFTILSGGGASALRAALMVLVALFAKKTNRMYSADRAFGLAVVVMLLWNPMLLVFDPSFQLSILATIGLIFVSPFIEPYLTRVTEKYGLREILSSTIATQIVVLPFLIYNTGILSLVSLPVNVLILGTIPLTMLLGFLTGVVGLFSLYLSYIPALFAYVFLWYQLTIVHIGATLPFGAVTLPAFSFGFLILIYICIGVGLYFVHKKTTR